MAARLTDKQKKRIIADYIQIGSYNAVSKIHKVSATTVKNIVLSNADIVKKCEEKKEQNTADVLEYMESQREDVCKVLGICLSELKKAERYEKIPPQQIATTMAILIDKWAMISGPSKDESVEDALSKSLRELGEGLESDG